MWVLFSFWAFIRGGRLIEPGRHLFHFAIFSHTFSVSLFYINKTKKKEHFSDFMPSIYIYYFFLGGGGPLIRSLALSGVFGHQAERLFEIWCLFEKNTVIITLIMIIIPVYNMNPNRVSAGGLPAFLE